jgi:hypothetical protein
MFIGQNSATYRCHGRWLVKMYATIIIDPIPTVVFPFANLKDLSRERSPLSHAVGIFTIKTKDRYA